MLRPAPAQHRAPHPERAFAEAVQLYHTGQYPDAARALAAYRAERPWRAAAPEALYLEAQAALASDRERRTQRLLRRLQQTYPAHPRAQTAQLSLAQYYLEQGQAQRATRQLQEVAAAPSSPEAGARAEYLLGRSAQQEGALDTALSYFRQVYTRYPDARLAPAALYAQGVVQVRQQRYEAATASLERLGRTHPESPFAQNLGTVLGDVYYRVGRYEQAATELQRRLPTLDGPEALRALFLLGESYRQLGRGDDAAVQYSKILERAPNGPYAAPARFGMAWHYAATDRPSRAADAFAKVRGTGGPLAQKATYYEAVNRAQAGASETALRLYQAYVEANADGQLAARARYEAALLFYQQKQFAEAIEMLRPLTQSTADPTRIGRAYYWLGNAYLARDQRDAALDAYAEAVERDAAPPSVAVEGRFQRAWALYQEGRYAEAGAQFRALVEEAPQSDRGREALFWGGDAAYQQEQYDRARDLLRRFLETDPAPRLRAGAQYALAWTHFKQRRFAPAARRFRAVVQADGGLPDADIPYRQDARLRLADCYFALKRYEDALAAYDQVRGTGTDYALYQAGKALYFADRPAKALSRLQRFVERTPDSPFRPDALYRLGDIHFQQQRYSEARAAFQRLLKAAPDGERAPSAQYAIGDAYYNAGQMENAVSAYRAVLETYPQSTVANEAASSLFFALSAAGQQDRGEAIIADIADATSSQALTDRLRYQRARAAYQRGASSRALRLFRGFVRTASSPALVPNAYYYLGLLYADLDQTDEAQNYLQQLTEQYPDSEYAPEAGIRLGEIHLTRGAYAEAAAAYRAAATNEATPPALRAQARYGQSRALLQRGRTQDAEALLSTIVEAETEGPLRAAAQLGLGRVREAQGRGAAALDLYRRVLRQSDGETGAEALFRLGRQLRLRDRPQTALRELQRMPTLYAGYPEWQARALLEQARAHRDRGTTGQAVKLYEEVQQRFADTPFAETAEEEQQSLNGS
jgi:TolA-binding protein